MLAAAFECNLGFQNQSLKVTKPNCDLLKLSEEKLNDLQWEIYQHSVEKNPGAVQDNVQKKGFFVWNDDGCWNG